MADFPSVLALHTSGVDGDTSGSYVLRILGGVKRLDIAVPDTTASLIDGGDTLIDGGDELKEG